MTDNKSDHPLGHSMIVRPTHNCYPDLTIANDEVLAGQSLQGNLSAFDEIVRRYQGSIAASLHHLTASTSDLEDLVQETFVRAYRNLAKWQPSASLLSWIRRIGYNLTCDYLRKQKRNPLAMRSQPCKYENSSFHDQELEIADPSIPGEVNGQHNELLPWLLNQLSAEEALLVTLMYVDQLSVATIATRLQWGESRVKVKLHRIRKTLKIKLQQDHDFKTTFPSSI